MQNKHYNIYLIGPIGGQSYDTATAWRNSAKEILTDMGHTVYDPMSGKECLKNSKSIGVGLENVKYVENGYIYHSDLFRVRRADILLCNMTVAENAKSIGTFFELGYGTAHGKLIIMVANTEYTRKHPFVATSCIVVNTLDEAYEVVSML